MIYLDYTANTPADPDVLDAYLAAERRYIANPNSTHIAGQEARAEMERVTQSIAQHLGVQPAEIIYTSGASEANNLALKGIAHASRHIGKHIISTQLEHSSVGASLSALQQQGYEIDLLDIGRDGRVDLDQLRELMRDDTILVAVCAVDSELGTIQPIREIAGIVKPYPGCRLHVDATQAVGKTDLWLDGVDTMSFTAHKFYGPNGIGALYKRRGLVIEPQISGGASTTIYRSGTPTLGLAVSLDAALTKALAGQDADVLGEGGTPLFAALLTAADKLGMQYVATAHRARVETGADGVHTVCPPAGTGSDDSTILAALPQETLARLILPLGDFAPEDVAEMAEDFKV